MFKILFSAKANHTKYIIFLKNKMNIISEFKKSTAITKKRIDRVYSK
jgi:hypothetical protein